LDQLTQKEYAFRTHHALVKAGHRAVTGRQREVLENI
jgi:hypothetical protein